jgi:hypothetical protein
MNSRVNNSLHDVFICSKTHSYIMVCGKRRVSTNEPATSHNIVWADQSGAKQQKATATRNIPIATRVNTSSSLAAPTRYAPRGALLSSPDRFLSVLAHPPNFTRKECKEIEKKGNAETKSCHVYSVNTVLHSLHCHIVVKTVG